MASSDKASESWFSGLGKLLFSLQRRAASGPKNLEKLIENSKPLSNATSEEMAYKDKVDELKKRLSSAKDQLTEAKLDMVDLEEAYLKSKQMVTALHQEANSVHVSLNRYKEADNDEQSRASESEKDSETLKRLLAELAGYSTTVENLKSQNRSVVKSSQQQTVVLEHDLAEQRSEYQLLKEQVRAAQKLSFQQLESPYWMPQATKDTTRDLSQIQKKLKIWCEEWVNSDIFEGALSNTEIRARLLETVQHFVCLDNNNLLHNLSVTVGSTKAACSNAVFRTCVSIGFQVSV
ncbi:hypothetical protein BDV97DRAFT_26408 [Delphinella strobiligena]|nr:hypothetical protein BDV97DRAFT_26408 [Delphinella strobiligena]